MVPPLIGISDEKNRWCDKATGFYQSTYHYALTMLVLLPVVRMMIFEALGSTERWQNKREERQSKLIIAAATAVTL